MQTAPAVLLCLLNNDCPGKLDGVPFGTGRSVEPVPFPPTGGTLIAPANADTLESRIPIAAGVVSAGALILEVDAGQEPGEVVDLDEDFPGREEDKWY